MADDSDEGMVLAIDNAGVTADHYGVGMCVVMVAARPHRELDGGGARAEQQLAAACGQPGQAVRGPDGAGAGLHKKHHLQGY